MIPFIHNNLKSDKFRLLVVLLLILSLVSILLGIVVFNNLKQLETTQFENYQIIDYEIDGQDMRLLVADTPTKQAKGLMYVEEKPDNIDGMIFNFNDERIRFFWNKNTFMDLTLYWIRDNEVVGKSELPSIGKTDQVHTVQSPEKVDTVIEIID